VDEQARVCAYCGALIATVRCGGCYHMNVPEAVHCMGCGHALGLEPIPEDAELLCPDCQGRLSAFRGGAGVLHDCARCGGQLVEHALLRDLLEQREVDGSAAPRPAARRGRVDTQVRYRPCPACGQLMNRKNFAGSSGVVVDMCKPHGIWLDRGELPRLLAFAASGGLTRARARQKEEQELGRRGIVVERAAAVPLPGEEASGGADVLGFVMDVLDLW
jgi:Zn-finger nucleic acid-binding protein